MSSTALEGKRIIVGVSGSIAAYKAVLLVRLLVKAGAEVQVLMTPAATKFVAPLTFSTLSKRNVLVSVTSEDGWNNHVDLGLWADAYVIAPATANTLARLANGICDTVLAAVYLSARCPVLFAPAMDVDMWHHPSTQRNIELLESYGNELIPVGEGELASGLSGKGRLAEPEQIVSALHRTLRAKKQPKHSLTGVRVLITAGPTHEPLDPVRFIGNRSSGKTGLALCTELLNRGAEVTLVLGPINLPTPSHPNLKVVPVQTALEMLAASQDAWPKCQAGILVAAVADYRPATFSEQKIKKKGIQKDGFTLELVRNPDIAATLGSAKNADQRLIGFALETENGEQYALDKMERKGFDAIVLNQHTDEHSPFGSDRNTISILRLDGSQQTIENQQKSALAVAIVDTLETLLPIT